MHSERSRLFQTFKYAVYAFLAMNVYWFFVEEQAAAQLQFPTGVRLGDLLEAYASTIDTAAWVVLLIMFELETYVLDDRHFTPLVTGSIQLARIVCYLLIVSAFGGYIDNLLFFNDVVPLDGLSTVCALPEGWAYAVDLDEYTTITPANCASFPAATPMLQLPGMNAVVDAPGLTDIRALAWVDVINAGVWLLVVLVLEIDVQLQERNMLTGSVLHISNVLKVACYAVLLIAAIYWGVKGDFVDFWDAFLWLVAFFFIELNVVDWRHEAEQSGQHL